MAPGNGGNGGDGGYAGTTVNTDTSNAGTQIVNGTSVGGNGGDGGVNGTGGALGGNGGDGGAGTLVPSGGTHSTDVTVFRAATAGGRRQRRHLRLASTLNGNGGCPGGETAGKASRGA